MNAPVPADALRRAALKADTARFEARVEAARRANPLPSFAVRPPSPAIRDAMDALAANARQWPQARRDTLRQYGSDIEPCRDVRPGIGPVVPSAAPNRTRLP